MREAFKQINFSDRSRDLIDLANKIFDEYRAAGYALTLRQLYYQFVARGYLENTERSYKNLGSVINNGRLAGWIDWDLIEDRGRRLNGWRSFESAKGFVDEMTERFMVDLWATQENYVEVWVEKEALIGVVERACTQRRVPHFACKGYNSQSEQWRAGRRFRRHIDAGRSVVVLHLGDHDPSGMDMTRDNDNRLFEFTARELGALKLKRIALNWDQIERFNPPPNPTKLTDSRSRSYIENYGHESWELDALNPTYIDELVNSHLDELIDEDAWEKRLEYEAEGAAVLRKIVDRWRDIEQL